MKAVKFIQIVRNIRFKHLNLNSNPQVQPRNILNCFRFLEILETFNLQVHLLIIFKWT